MIAAPRSASRPFAPGEPPAFLPETARRDGQWLRLPLADLTVTVLHAAAAGEPRGTVLIVPGHSGSKEDHLDLLPELAARGWDAWSYSQRGQADSEAARRPDGRPDATAYALGDFVGDLLQVAEAVRARTAGERLHVVGHSFGGVVAADAAIADASHFGSLTLLCSGVRRADTPRADQIAEQRERIRARDTGAASLQHRRGTDPRLAAPAADWDGFVAARHLAHAPESMIGSATLLAEQADRAAQIRATGLPLHVLHGRDDHAWVPDRYEAIADELGARFTWIEDAGHSPNQEQPERTADALTAFWGGLG